MAEQTPKPPAAPQPPEAPKPPKIENLTFQGVQTKDLPEHLRARHNKLAKLHTAVLKERGVEPASGPAKAVAPKPANREDLARLAQIRSELPSDEARAQYKKQVRKGRTLLEGGFGQTALDDKERRLDRILKKRGKEGASAEEREAIVQKLIKDAADKVEYDPTNFLFNPEERAIDYDAAEVLQIWSMDNLATKFESPIALYKNFGDEYRRQQALAKEAGELLKKTAQERAPDYVLNARINGENAIAVPRFGEAMDAEFAEAAGNDQLLSLMYGNNIDPKILSMYAKGLRLDQDDAAIREAMGNDTDAEFIRQNAFHADKPGRAVDFYMPVNQTPDGTLEIPYEDFQLSIENYMFQIERKKRGFAPGEMPADEAEKLRDSVRERTKVLLTPMKQTESRVLHKDPEGALRDFQEGRGWRAGLLNIGELATTILSLGQKEKVLNNLPDRVLKAYMAMTLPRRAAGVVLEEGKEVDYTREGDFFVPAFGDSAPTNALDYIIRLISLDEPWTRAFAMSVDDEARSKRDMDVGRPGRIAAGMLKHIGTEDHVAYLTKDDMAGGRYINEFGDAFINPLLNTMYDTEENPDPGRVIGGLIALGTMIFSPDALTATAVGAAGAGRAMTAARRAAGLTDKLVIAKGAEDTLTLLELGKARGLLTDEGKLAGDTEAKRYENLSEMETLLNKGNEVLEGASTDRTGGIRAFQLLAGMDTSVAHGVATPFAKGVNQSMKTTMAQYIRLGKTGDQLTKKLKSLEDAVAKAKQNEDLVAQANLETAVIRNRTEQMQIALEQEKLVMKSLRELAENEDVLKALDKARKQTPKGAKAVQMHNNLPFITDAFEALSGKTTMASVVAKYKLTDGVDMVGRKNLKLMRRQHRALVASKLADALEGVPIKGLDKALDLAPQMKLVGHKIGHIVNGTKFINNISKNVDTVLKRLVKAEDLPEATQLTLQAANRNDLLTALNNRYDRAVIGAKRVEEAAAAEAANIAKLEQEKVALSLLTEPQRQQRAVNGYDEYLTRLAEVARSGQTVARMDEKLFDSVLEATQGRVREAFDEDIVKGADDSAVDLTESLKDFVKDAEDAPTNLTGAVYDTSTVVKFFRDPLGDIQIATRGFEGDFSISNIVRNKKAFGIWLGIEAEKLFSQYSFFRTNVRYLETRVSRELDDAAKITNRRTNDIMDSLDLIADNITDAAEAGRLIRKVLTTTDGVIEITARGRLPLTRGATIALTGIVGRSESLVTTFIKHSKNMYAAKLKSGSDTMARNQGLDAAIKAFIPDSSMVGRSDFLTPGGKFSKTRDIVYTEIMKLPDDMPADKQMDALADIIRNAISNKDGANLKVGSDTGIAYARSITEMHKSIVFGAMQADLTERVFNIVGPRFNRRMGRAMNYMMSLGQDSMDNFALRDFDVGDYVILRSDAELISDSVGLAAKEAGRRPEKGAKAEELGRSMTPLFKEQGVDAATYSTTRRGESLLDDMATDLEPSLPFPTGLEAERMQSVRVKNKETEKFETVAMNPVDHLGNPIGPNSTLLSEQDLVRWLSDNAVSDTHRQLARMIESSASADSPVVFFKADELPEGAQISSGIRTHAFVIEDLTPANILSSVVERVNFAGIEGVDNVISAGNKGRYFKGLEQVTKPYINLKTGRWTKRGKKLIRGLGIAEEKTDVSNLARRLQDSFESQSSGRMLLDPEIRQFLDVFKVDNDVFGSSPKVIDLFYPVFRQASKEDKNALGLLIGDTLSRQAVKHGYRMKPEGTAAMRTVRPDGKVRIKQSDKTQRVEDTAAPRKAQKEFYRLPKLEAEMMDAMGKSAFRILRIEGDRVYVTSPKSPKGEPEVLSKSDIVHRDIGFSMLDAIDGFHALGMEVLTNAGRMKADEAMKSLRADYQRMVIAGVDEAGNVRMLPEAFIASLTDRFSSIEKQLDEAISVKAAQSSILSSFGNKYLTFLRFWKTHILTGLVIPRPAYFMNQFFGDYSQMVLTQGVGRATKISAVGALGYIPIYGDALQEAFLKMASRAPAGTNVLPTATGSIMNVGVDKILKGSDEMMPGMNMTYGQFYDEALGAGIGEGIRVKDFATSIRKSLERAQNQNPTLFERLANAGQPLGYMQRVMELKIREVSRRQRLLFYADMRVNRGLDAKQATQELKNTLYDWSHSVGEAEMNMIGQYVLFYTLSKNAMAQVFRMFFEASDVGLREYTKRYAKGQTQLQRFEIMSRLMTQYPTPAAPFETLEGQEVRDRAGALNIPDYLEEYPLLSLHTLPPDALKVMSEGGFIRSHYARTLPKATAVEYALNAYQIAGALTALVVAAGNRVDPEGRVIPYSANGLMAMEQLTSSVIDQYMVPLYGDISKDFLEELVGLRDIPQSQYGRRVKKGDMMMYELLGKAGALSPMVLTDDPKEPGTKRVSFKGLGPFTDPILSIPTAEYHRFRMMLGLAFPGMAPTEIKALAAEGGDAQIRLEALADILNVGRAMFYNGNDEIYYQLDEVRDRLVEKNNLLRRQAESD